MDKVGPQCSPDLLHDGEKLPPWARKEIDAICRKFFWAGRDALVRGKCMFAWETVCKPTRLGGLGVTDLRAQARWIRTASQVVVVVAAED